VAMWEPDVSRCDIFGIGRCRAQGSMDVMEGIHNRVAAKG
jgi:hypothetical protein